MDKSFFEQTGGNNQEEKDKRNVGTLKLILMVEAVLQDTYQGKEILQEQKEGNKNKEHIAEAVLFSFLQKHGLRDYAIYYVTHEKTLTVDQVAEVAEIAKKEIFKKLGL